MSPLSADGAVALAEELGYIVARTKAMVYKYGLKDGGDSEGQQGLENALLVALQPYAKLPRVAASARRAGLLLDQSAQQFAGVREASGAKGLLLTLTSATLQASATKGQETTNQSAADRKQSKESVATCSTEYMTRTSSKAAKPVENMLEKEQNVHEKDALWCSPECRTTNPRPSSCRPRSLDKPNSGRKVRKASMSLTPLHESKPKTERNSRSLSPAMDGEIEWVSFVPWTCYSLGSFSTKGQRIIKVPMFHKGTVRELRKRIASKMNLAPGRVALWAAPEEDPKKLWQGRELRDSEPACRAACLVIRNQTLAGPANGFAGVSIVVVRRLMQDLLEGYRAAFGSKGAQQKSQGELICTVQMQVLPKYGFAPNILGLTEMMRTLDMHLHDGEVWAIAWELAKVLDTEPYFWELEMSGKQ